MDLVKEIQDRMAHEGISGDGIDTEKVDAEALLAPIKDFINNQKDLIDKKDWNTLSYKLDDVFSFYVKTGLKKGINCVPMDSVQFEYVYPPIVFSLLCEYGMNPSELEYWPIYCPYKGNYDKLIITNNGNHRQLEMGSLAGKDLHIKELDIQNLCLTDINMAYREYLEKKEFEKDINPIDTVMVYNDNFSIKDSKNLFVILYNWKVKKLIISRTVNDNVMSHVEEYCERIKCELELS